MFATTNLQIRKWNLLFKPSLYNMLIRSTPALKVWPLVQIFLHTVQNNLHRAIVLWHRQKRSKRAKRRAYLGVSLTYNIEAWGRELIDLLSFIWISICYIQCSNYTVLVVLQRCARICALIVIHNNAHCNTCLHWRLEYMKSARVQPHLPAFAIAHACILGLH